MGEGLFSYIQSGSGMLPWIAVFATATGGGFIVGAGYLLIRNILPGKAMTNREFRLHLRKKKPAVVVESKSVVVDGRAAVSAYQQVGAAQAAKSPRRSPENQEWQSRALNLYMERISDLQTRLNRVNEQLESYLVETKKNPGGLKVGKHPDLRKGQDRIAQMEQST